MSAFDGKAFLMGIQHLDAKSRALFEQHGHCLDGRWTLAEQIIDEAMVRLLGCDLDANAPSVQKLE